jgi:protein TonB
MRGERFRSAKSTREKDGFMLDDFRPSTTAGQSRKRFRGSVAAAIAIYGTFSAAIVGATSAIRSLPKEELHQVPFARLQDVLQEPPAPPPATKPLKADKPASVKRVVRRTPQEVPSDKPKESDQALESLAESGSQGPLDGTQGGTGASQRPPALRPPPPLPRTLPLIRPVAFVGDDRPRYSASARRKGIEGIVVVGFDVLEDGSVANLQILSGPPELHESVLRAARLWRFKPANRGGEAVRYHMTKSVVFRLEDA